MNKQLFQRIEDLPKSLQQQVLDFIEYIISKNKSSQKNKSRKSKPAFKWQGALRSKYKNTGSVELQHKIWE